MKEEQFKQTIKNIQLPDIKTQGHQRRLRMALLDADYLYRQSEKAIQKQLSLKGVMYTMKETIKQALTAQQPVWKTATFSMLALALVLGLSLTLPGNTKSVYAQAEETIQECAAVKDALGGEEIQVTRIDISDLVGKAIATGKSGSILAELDLKTNTVTGVSSMASFEVDDQMAIEIAEADPRVKELIDAGAVIGDVSKMQVFGQMGNYMTGELDDISEAIVMVDIVAGDVTYVAYIDITEGIVTKLLESIPGPTLSGSGSSFVEDFSIPDDLAK